MREKTEEDRGLDDVLGGRVGTGEGDAQSLRRRSLISLMEQLEAG